MEAVNEIELRIEHAQRSFNELKAEMARVIVGHEDLIEQVFIALVCGGHCLLEGVPGLGKTLMVRSLGESLSLTFSGGVYAGSHAGGHHRHQCAHRRCFGAQSV